MNGSWKPSGCGVMAVLLLILVGAARPANAQTGASSTAAAEALFNEGRSLMEAGRYAEACPKLAASQRLDPGAGTLINLAGCYAKNGQTASAWATYLEAAAASSKSDRKDWEERARARAAEIEPTLSRLTIRVAASSDIAGLTITRDGSPVARAEWGSAIPVDPGDHRIEASAPGMRTFMTTTPVGSGPSQVTVAIPTLEPEPSAASSEPPPGILPPTGQPTSNPPQDTGVDSDTGSTQRTIGLVVGGVGVVSVVVGSVFGLTAKSTHDDALSHCTEDFRCTSEGLDLDDKARSQATVSTVFFGLGAAALVGGAVLYLTAPSDDGSALALEASPRQAGATLSLGGAW